MGGDVMPYYHYIHTYKNHPWWKMSSNYQRKQFLNDREWYLNKGIHITIEDWLNRKGCKCF